MGLSPWGKFLNTLQIRNDYSERPAGLRWRSNTIFILTTVAIGLFTDMFLYGLVVSVIPFLLEDRVGVPSDQVQSLTSALLAIFAGSCVVFSPVAGILADAVSTRQAPFLIGLSTLIGATVLLFVGTTVPVLVVARTLQGVSSAFVWTVGLAMCIETVGPKNLGKTIGTMFSFITTGAIWAPFLGGTLYDKTGVYGVMAVALAVLGVDFLMRAFVIEKKVALRYPAEEIVPSNAQSSDNSQPDGQIQQNGDGERQPLLGDRQQEAEEDEEDLSAYKISEQRGRIARTVTILPCLGNSRLLVALLTAFVQAIVFGSIDSTVAIVSNELFGFSSLKAGMMFLPLGVFDLLFGPLAGWIIDRSGTKVVAVVGFTWLVPIHVLLRLPHAGGWDQIILYGALLAGLGIGCAATGSPAIVESGAIVDRYHRANSEFFGENGPYAQLYGLNSMVFNLGLTIGPELAGELKLLLGYGDMNIIMAVICGVTAILCFVYMGGKPKILRSKS